MELTPLTTYRRLLPLRLVPAFVLGGAAAAVVGGPAVRLIAAGGVAYTVFTSLVIALIRITISSERLTWKGLMSVSLSGDQARSCTFRHLYLDGRSVSLFVFVVSGGFGRTILIPRYGWTKMVRRALFRDLESWLTRGNIPVGIETRKRLESARH